MPPPPAAMLAMSPALANAAADGHVQSATNATATATTTTTAATVAPIAAAVAVAGATVIGNGHGAMLVPSPTACISPASAALPVDVVAAADDGRYSFPLPIIRR